MNGKYYIESIEDKIKEIPSKMSIEEKVWQICE